jgi:hypothetical protein
MSSLNWVTPGQELPSPTTTRSPHTVFIKKTISIYPPVGYLIAETLQIKKTWETFLATLPMSDPRKNCDRQKEVLLLDHPKLAYIVQPGESVVFRDFNNHKLVGCVYQVVIGNKKVTSMVLVFKPSMTARPTSE